VSGNEAVIQARLDGVLRRLRLVEVLRGVAGGTVLAVAGSGTVIWGGGTVVAAGATGAIAVLVVTMANVWRTAANRTQSAAARQIERYQPAFRNLLITAEELLRVPRRSPDWIRARVIDDAARVIRGESSASHIRLRGPALAAAAAIVLWGVTLRSLHRPVIEAVRDRAADALAAVSGVPSVRATIIPPAYTAAPSFTVTDPERIDALEGSRIQLVVAGRGSWRIRLGTIELGLTRDGNRWTADTRVTTSGYLAVEPAIGNGSGRKLIALSVTPDRAPSVKVDAPGRDLLLPDASRRIPIRATAADDLGLRSFELRYTKVSGTGEQFEFVEGALPLTIARDSGTAWRGDGELALTALRLERGDSLVYRVVARDGRPGIEGLGSSDTYFVEIAGPGQVALAGIDMPPDQDRYALSQQMIVLKIERLRAREAGMPRDALREEIETVAAEQRAVRANFIFLMGGHVEDEEEEAEQSHEIQEGRLENRARRDISAAVRHMTLAERGLAALSTSAALPPARAAVEALQRAFGHSRYILRASPLRSRIDFSRRLSGELRSASGWMREADGSRGGSIASRARTLMARVRALEAAGGRVDRDALGRLAEESLAVDPASPEWQEISVALSRGRLGPALSLLHLQAQKDVLPQADILTPPTRLWSAWAEQRR
jgi:hypothetical protein